MIMHVVKNFHIHICTLQVDLQNANVFSKKYEISLAKYNLLYMLRKIEFSVKCIFRSLPS